ncbi:transcriptional regulator [Erysipelothrix sp. HDW6C]|uniref:SIR2 family NAD-dependent protein deacylase n=1 Tax=Erysipelothrix sp. HDW6C TaxID=2714930 RepID=UPI00140D250B|nr:Sir2 family NAD-dependent protein deacetylase [Erysipelothrix sp. HDW6C]QIK69048.1 transcriptional regulator [Erysipelothrix sp. HDW6C]
MIIALTGAGISKASGLNTFDEMPGIRQKLNREYLEKHPEDFRASVAAMGDVFSNARPNDAHLALAEYNIPVITMNVDGLHEQAGSHPINLHGTVPTQEEREKGLNLENRPVLYGEQAPNYPKGIALVQQLKTGDVLLVIGASEYTVISNDIRKIAANNGASVIEIQKNAEINTRKVLENLIKGGSQ